MRNPVEISNARSLTLLSPFYESPATPQEAAVIITMISSCFPEAEVDDTIRKARLQGYLIAVEDYQASVLKAVARKIIRGEAGLDKRYMPTPPQLRELCNQTRGEMVRASRPKAQPDPVPEPVWEPDEAELQRRAEKAEAASRLIGVVASSKDLRRVLTRIKGENEKAAEAREMAAALVPMTDEEIAAWDGGAAAA